MRLLVTRPEPDATALKAQLIARGHEVLIEPLLKIVFQPLDDIELDGVQALIATSRNGVRALAQNSGPRPAGGDTAADSFLEAAQTLPLYAVGPGTGATAKALGFQQVIEGPRDASALIALIALQAEVNAGPLLYLSGDTPAADVAGELRHLGFPILEPVVYATALSDKLSAPVVARFEAGDIDGVLLFSAQTARTYARLIQLQGLGRKLARVTHYCLSAQVAQGLKVLSPALIVTANRPNMQEVLALIERGAPQSS